MQIVRDLGGYTLGRSDLVRRAMSKKKQSVMEKERANFVYGNEEEGVPGCVSKGISEQVAGRIYEDMMDFAKYAFNKSHAACYAVVSYQTAYLKHYYPVEFMAALLTSVIDNSKKVSEYILVCRNMGISILPPDINEGEAGFSVSGNAIRYALTAIKGVGRPVIESIAGERRERGRFTNLKDFITRVADLDVNKRAIENFIKAGALDSLGGTRKQCMSVYVQILDHITKDKKNNMAGQMSLFDIATEDSKEEFDIRMPEVGEYPKEMMLAFEKEVLGIYVSGHPLEEYQELLERHITHKTTDFMLDEETGVVTVPDQINVVIGGMIAEKTVKYTKNDKVMAFLNIEDLVGNVEVVVFPKDYEKYSALLMEDAKVFIKGRTSVEEEKDGKLICEQIVSFEDAVQGGELFHKKYGYGKGGNNGGQPYSGRNSWGYSQSGYGGNGASNGTGQPISGASGTQQVGMADTPAGGNAARPQAKKLPDGVWIQFATVADFEASERKLYDTIADSEGNDQVVIFIKENKAIKILPPNRNVCANMELQMRLGEVFGAENVKFRIKPIENQ